MVNEEDRLKELDSYQVIDTAPEKELDELANIAKLICDVPFSFITIIDKNEQWLKVNSGLNFNKTSRKDSFCQYALNNPNEVMMVNDLTKDQRFKDNPFVKGNPKIRFYAGAPLATPKGNVLGTLCIFDQKPREISSNHRKALLALAKKAMDHLNHRKLILEQRNKIESNAEELKRLTDNVPIGIFLLKKDAQGKLSFEFLNRGLKNLQLRISYDKWQSSPELGFELVHPEDKENFKKNLLNSFNKLKPLYTEYRLKSKKGYRWHFVTAQAKKTKDGSVLLYGCFQDINNRVELEKAIEQISFDISHVLRKPVTSLLGLTQLIHTEKVIKKAELREYVDHIKSVSLELDSFTRELYTIYNEKRKKFNSVKK